MNASTVWKATSATIDEPQRRFMAALWGLMTLISIVFLQARGMGAFVVMPYAFGMALWWAFVAARALLVQRDARSLRVPGVDQTVVANLLLQYALSVLVPAAALALAGKADFQHGAAFLSCIVALSLVFQLLPRYVGAFLAILPASMHMLHAHGVIPGLSEPGFVVFGWTFAAVTMAIVVWRWVVALDTHADCTSWATPLVLQAPRKVGLGATLNNWDSLMGAPGGNGLTRLALLDDVGPRSAVRALRVWLGGAFVPVSAQARFGQIAIVLMPMLVVVAVSLIGPNSAAGWAVFVVFVGGALFTLMIMSVAPARLQRLYADASGELSLLALLPGIDAASAKRTLLAAALGLPLKALGFFYAFVVVITTLSGGDLATLLAVSLCALAALAFGSVLSLSIAAARPVPKAGMLLICSLGPILLFATPIAMAIREHGHALDLASKGLLAGWFTLYAVLAWLLVRGYGAYMRRPHAFLLNER
jgi:hypothetical protein